MRAFSYMKCNSRTERSPPKSRLDFGRTERE